MAPSDIHLFPKLKSHLCGTKYGSYEGNIEAVNKYFGDQEMAFYFECVKKLEQRWAKCIALKGDYIEKMVIFSFPGSPMYKGPRTF